MVNINVFGRLNENKKEMAEEKKIATVFITNKEGMDAESALLVENGRCSRRGKFACLACIADLCALAVIILIVLCTSLLLMRLWWVKKEVDLMEPTVQRVMEDILRLRQQADSIQAENQALLGAPAYQKGFQMAKDVDTFPMEDVSREALVFLSNEDKFSQPTDSSDDNTSMSKDTDMIMMMIMAGLKDDLEATTEATEAANLTAELLTLHAAESSLLDSSDPLPRLEPQLNTGYWTSMDLKTILADEEDDDDEETMTNYDETTKAPDSDIESDDD